VTDVTNDPTDYDRAVVLAEAMSVRVVETTQDEIIERWGIVSSAVLVTRSKQLVRGLTRSIDYDGVAPWEQGIFLAERRHGSAIAVMHELGHAAMHDGRSRNDPQARAREECEAWVWAIKRLGRDLTPAERRDITECLRGYGVGLKHMRTHVLLTNDSRYGILSVPPTKEA